MKPLGSLQEAVDTAVDAVRRTTLGSLGVRLLAWGSGFAALWLVVPSGFAGPVLLVVALVVALCPAVAPRSWLVLAVELVVAAGWIIRTAVAGEPVTWLPLIAVAGTLYLHHTTCALAAVLPLDARLMPGAARRWFARVGIVVAATALLAIAALDLLPRPDYATPLVVPVAGVLLVTVLTALLAYAVRRRR
ncbi:hypothetical protein [Actinopolymorpha alba]|uniref:hypothetical protein n=1 Tax=Actinopolymorpha alba TaxID=533267 RepID=UPI00037867CA|nr:hypothetical protein [Actinopolymorpha alba]